MTRPAQPTLFPVAAPPRPLTDRQTAALEILQRAGGEGLRADELGAALCERNGRHAAGDRCDLTRSMSRGAVSTGWTVTGGNGCGTVVFGIAKEFSPAAFGDLPEGF